MKIFSFCIYGDDIKYYLGLRENIYLIRKYFPDFHIFIYRGLNRNDDLLKKISESKNIHWIDTNKEGAINMLYRYHPIIIKNIETVDIEIIIVRDADSEINERDRWAIRDFLEDTSQKKSVQTIRDHYYHKSRLTGGLTCFHLKRLKRTPEIFDSLMTEFIKIFQDFEIILPEFQYGSDEKTLNERIWPLIKDQLIVYSNINVFEEETYRIIDFENDGYNFCGNVVIYEEKKSEEESKKKEIKYKKSYQFNYFKYPVLEQVIWLYLQKQPELVIDIIDEYGFHRLPIEYKSHILDYVILSLISRNSIDAMRECFIKYQEFAKYDILDGIKNQVPRFFEMVRSLGYKIIGTCDTEYIPKLFEFVIYFGNYPDDYMSLPQSYQIYRHFLFFKDIKLDRFISNRCFSNIDRIFIMGLEGEFERMHDTWMHLCGMNAPLDRIEEYRAKKDKELQNIYIGATKNHMDCLEKMRESRYETCLFLEDDFVFISNKKYIQESLSEFFKRDYDYNICFLSASKYHKRRELDDLLIESKQVCTTSSGYLVSKNSIDTVYNKVKEGYELLIQNPDKSDIYCIDRFWTSLDKLYIFKKKLGFQKPSLSKITGNMNMNLD